jgi:hypothetical protein
MTKNEKKHLDELIRATEYLFLENMALKLVLEHRAVSNWQELVDKILADEEVLAGVHLEFEDFYKKLGQRPDRTKTLRDC